MGGMKDLLIEMLESPEPLDTGIDIEVGFLCPICGYPAAAYVVMPTDDEASTEQVECLNPDIEAHTWSVQLRHTTTGIKASVDGHPGARVSVKLLDTSDDWMDPPPEPGSYGIFLGALEEWRFNVLDLGSPDGDSSRNRMLFSTLYSIVEAYLSDTITSAALNDKVIQGRLLKLDGLKSKVVSLETVFTNPDIVRDMIKTTLQGLSFHNLRQVNGICSIAFGKSILPDDAAERAKLIHSVDKRHDCVHRNGLDKDGKKHTDITREYLSDLGTIFEKLAENLENAIQDAKFERFLEDVGTAEVK